MNLANKTFKNIRTGEVIKVIDSFEDIAILENKTKISVKELVNSNLYTEEIDPKSFFNNQSAYDFLANKIKNIPTEMIKDEDGTTPISTNVYDDKFRPLTNESAIMYSSEDDEKAELVKKYGAVMDSQSQLKKQNDAFSRILGEESDEVIQTSSPNIQKNESDVLATNKRTEKQVETTGVEDPIITMFKRAKRIVELEVTVEINNKIPRIDFIEMMEDTYDQSMIDFLADEFTREIINNPEFIKQSIKDKITTMVYNKPSVVDSEITDALTNVNSQITDSVTQVLTPTDESKSNKSQIKTRATRNSRSKKIEVKND